MDRRGFLRGAIATAPAAILGPGIVDLAGGREDVGVVLLSDQLDPDTQQASNIQAKLHHRIEAHGFLFGEPPKALFVSRYEIRALHLSLSPLVRFQDDNVAQKGLPNLVFKGVRVICVDGDSLYLDPRGEERE